MNGYTEVYNPLISRFEEPFVYNIAKKVCTKISPNVATAVAVLSSIIAFMLFLVAPRFPLTYLFVCFCVFCHCVFDGIDGKIAKIRGKQQKHGYAIDKSSDLACSLLFATGFALAVNASVFLPILTIVNTFIIHAVYRGLYFFKKIDLKIGGTEARIVMIVLCVYRFLTV